MNINNIILKKIPQTENNISWQGGREIRTLVHRCWKCEMGQPPWETLC